MEIVAETLPQAEAGLGRRPSRQHIIVECMRCRQRFWVRCGHEGGGPRRRFCSRECLLASIGLPADFDPAVLNVRLRHVASGDKVRTQAWRQEDVRPEAEAAIRAVLDAVPASRGGQR